MLPGPVAVGVVLRERRGVLAGEAGVLRDQTLFHPLLLLHPPVLEPDFDLKKQYFYISVCISECKSRCSFKKLH